METKKLKIVVTERKHEGRSFNVFHTFSKNGRRTEVKFRKEVKNLPDKTCYVVVNVDDMNLNTSGEFPICWIKAIQSIEDLEVANLETNRQKINEYFE